MSLRDYTLLYARREKDKSTFDIVEWPSGTFMTASVVPGLTTPNHRYSSGLRLTVMIRTWIAFEKSRRVSTMREG